jgi:hypothetical protein
MPDQNPKDSEPKIALSPPALFALAAVIFFLAGSGTHTGIDSDGDTGSDRDIDADSSDYTGGNAVANA